MEAALRDLQLELVEHPERGDTDAGLAAFELKAVVDQIIAEAH